MKIVDIEYFTADKVPFPLDKVKRILRKCTENDCKSQKSEDNLMYSDYWMKPDYHSVDRIKVTETVGYRVWTDNKGTPAGIIVNFETATDFYYELMAADWHRFLAEVLFITGTAAIAAAFREYLAHHQELLAFEEALKSYGIPFKKTAFY